MDILSIYFIENTSYGAIIKGFIEPFYAGDDIHHFETKLENVNQDLQLQKNWFNNNIIFSNYKDAHKHAFIKVFGEEQYSLE